MSYVSLKRGNDNMVEKWELRNLISNVARALLMKFKHSDKFLGFSKSQGTIDGKTSLI